MKNIFQLIEKEGNKPITFPYFLSLLAYKMQDKDAEKHLLNAFNVFDKNNNGSIET